MNFITHSLFMLALTGAAYQFGSWLYNRGRPLALFQPVIIAILLVYGFISVFDISYLTYRRETQILIEFLGPAIVALAVPLHDSVRKVMSAVWPILGTIVIGGAGVVGAGFLAGNLVGLNSQMNLSLLTRSMTAPIALSIAEKIGGDASLTLLGVFISGIIGSVITPTILDMLRVENNSIRGFTLGFTSHAFGVARSLGMGAEAVAFATIGMGTMGCFGAIILPLLFQGKIIP